MLKRISAAVSLFIVCAVLLLDAVGCFPGKPVDGMVIANSADHIQVVTLSGAVIKNATTREAWIKVAATDGKVAELRQKMKRIAAEKGLSSGGYENFSHTMSLYECDRDGHRCRIKHTIDYDDKGGIISDDNSVGEWQTYPPASIAEMITNTIYRD